jgi:hypothetical protein
MGWVGEQNKWEGYREQVISYTTIGTNTSPLSLAIMQGKLEQPNLRFFCFAG